MSRIPWIFGVLLLAGSLLGAGLFYSNAQNHQTISSDPTHDMLPNQSMCRGVVDAKTGVAKLHPAQIGKVEWVVEEGSFVKKNDPLIKLDSRQATYQRLRAEAALKSAEGQFEQAKSLPEKHEKEVQAQEGMITAASAERDELKAKQKAEEDFYGNKKTGENLLLAYKKAVEKLDAVVKLQQEKLAALKLAKPEIDVARAEHDVTDKLNLLNAAKQAEDECVLRAPSNGTVLRVQTHVGELIGPAPPMPALEFAPAETPDETPIVRAEIMQEWASAIRPGQTVTIEDDAIHPRDQFWQGKVKNVGKWYAHKRNIILEPLIVNDVRTLECVIEVTSKGPRPLIIGQRVRVIIDTTK